MSTTIPRYYVQWDDGNYSCHAQRDLKRVGTLYGLSHA